MSLASLDPENSANRRAAQYVRMSTDYQKYSTANQMAAIAEYAAQHDCAIVRTYLDEGRSGLRIESRPGLKELVGDVVLGRADFDLILVYDVSRWGRFQDADESAHYEFICKQAGVRIEYCTEEFQNDGSTMSTVIKNLKRIMAGEYSRELSKKVFAGQCRLVRLGFWQGGTPGYGLRRLMVDENGKPKGPLVRGQRKNLQSDHVIVVPGPTHELELIREVFRQCVNENRTDTQIARKLNAEGLKNRLGNPWTNQAVRYLLSNENYIGTLLYNRKTCRLGATLRTNLQSSWIKVPGVLTPVIDEGVFWRAQKIKKRRRVRLANREMLALLEALFREKGRLSATLIDEAEELPNSDSYVVRFGSLSNAYKLINYAPKFQFHPVDANVFCSSIIAKFADDLISKIEIAGGKAAFERASRRVTIDGGPTISVYLARCRTFEDTLHWYVHRRDNLGGDWIVALRLDRTQTSVLDYLLMPVAGFPKRAATFSSVNPARINRCRYKAIDELIPAFYQESRIVFGKGRPRSR